jgi:hypothetical protein
MSAAEQILAAIAGGLQGGYEGYTYAKDYEQKEREIDNRKEIARLNGELRLMFEQLRTSGSDKRNQDSIEGRLEQERIRQGGADARNSADNSTVVTVAGMRDETARRGQDLDFFLGSERNANTRRGQTMNFTLGLQRDQTDRRGQDITQQLGMDAEKGRENRSTTANALRRAEMASRERIAARRRLDPWAVTFDAPADDIEEGATTKPTGLPVEVREKPLANTGALPPAAPVRSPEASADQDARLEQQARSLLAQFRKEADPAKKAALRTQLQRLRDQIAAAKAKSGGQ